MLTPFDCYKKAWMGDTNSKAHSSSSASNPFLEPFFDQIRGMMHKQTTDALSHAVVDNAIQQGLVSQKGAQVLLPVVTLVMDKIVP